MNEHQYRLWKSMVHAIDNYINGKNQDFSSVVSQIQGALDACEIKDDYLFEQWYSFWTPLEILRATMGNEVNKDQALPDLIEIKKFILNCLGKPPQTERQYQLWKSMIDAIDSYLRGETQDFSGTVAHLETALDPSEFKDVDLISQWYGFWKPLENRRATEANQVNKLQVIEELTAMREFLLANLGHPPI